MDTFVEEIYRVTGKGEEEEEEEEEGGEENYDAQTKESAFRTQQRQGCRASSSQADKEVYHYAGQEICIEVALDSYAGMVWPEALALSHYLDTHREQFNLVDKEVLELGAGTGLVSVVAALLGAWVTATDRPEVLENLRVNLGRNTRGRCRHTPQATALSWGYDLERTHPRSLHRYDYVLAADVVYHHDFLDELLATMKHFCQPGTTVIWANKVRVESDLTFTENFQKAFHTRLLAEDGDTKIFMATSREDEGEGEEGVEIQGLLREEEEEVGGMEEEEGRMEEEEEEETREEEKQNEESGRNVTEAEGGDEEGERNEHTATDEDVTAAQRYQAPAWVPHVISSLGKDIYHYAGEDILIYESMDSYGAVMWPGALALCSFLDHNRDTVNLQGKQVLELGAGTGLVAIVACLLGAAVTATDLPDVLGNLRANTMRNTRGRCRHLPQVEVLSWGYDLERSHPASLHRYDYVLAADVVYHHDFLDELLATMKHFCRPGTTVIWANKVRFETDLTFTENFQKAFHTRLLADDGDIRIFMATSREERDRPGWSNKSSTVV